MLNAIPAVAMAPTMLSNRSNNKELRNKILIFIICLLIMNALGILLCIQFPQLTGVFEMTSITLTLITAACIFVLPKFFSRAKSSADINHEEQLLSNLTICNPERRVVTEYNMSQVNDLLSENCVSDLTRSVFLELLKILATNSEGSCISPTMAPFLAYIISAIDHTICSSINAAIKTIEVVTENVIESSTTKAICSSINTTAAVTHNMIDSSLGYISSTLSSINLKLILLGQLLSNPADFFGAMRLNSRS